MSPSPPGPTPATLDSHASLARRLRRLEVGQTLELRGLGRSLWPVIRSGARLTVERVPASAVRTGDLAVAWLESRQSLVCHLVVATRPVRTAALLGPEDDDVEVLAVVRRATGPGVLIRRPGPFRPLLPLLRRGALKARETGWTRQARDAAKLLLEFPPSVRLRRAYLGPIELRRLGPQDFEALAIYAGHHLPTFRAAFMEEQLRGAWTRSEGGSVGVFNRAGALVGSAYLGRYSDEGVAVAGYWIRAVYVAPMYRGFGLARRLVAELLELAREQGHAEVFVDIRADNAHSLALHGRLGFEPVEASLLPDLAPLSALDGAGAPRVFLRHSLEPTTTSTSVVSTDP